VPSVAASATALTVSCSGFRGSGTVPPPLTYSGCTGTGSSVTGSGGTELTENIAPAESEVIWKTGKTSYFHWSVSFPTHTCATKAGFGTGQAQHRSGSDYGGTAKALIGGAFSGSYCLYQSGARALVIGYGVQHL
jgi:hypothetical protein